MASGFLDILLQSTKCRLDANKATTREFEDMYWYIFYLTVFLYAVAKTVHILVSTFAILATLSKNLRFNFIIADRCVLIREGAVRRSKTDKLKTKR